jgi:2-succinyl-5-enolpyruvyl-6-hydroxy-3-cyclohexene-1-carboxylate synthase
VLEASHAAPLIVCTADRPPELRDTGAGQAVDQLNLYGRAVRWFCEVGVPGDHPGAATSWRSIAARAVAESVGPPAGPVHLNLAFREPLVPTGAPLVDAPGRPDGRPWTAVTRPTRAPDEVTVARIAEAVRAHPRGLIVAGWGSDAPAGTVDRFAAAAGWPVLADPISGLRHGPHAISTYEALLRSPGFAQGHRPELVLRLGGAPTSKPLTAWLGPEVRNCSSTPTRRGSTLVGAWPSARRRGRPLLDALTGSRRPRGRRSMAAVAGRRTHGAPRFDDLLDGWETLFEGRVRDTVDALPPAPRWSWPPACRCAMSKHSPGRVRAFAYSPTPRQRHDGFVSTVLGARPPSSGPTVALLATSVSCTTPTVSSAAAAAASMPHSSCSTTTAGHLLVSPAGRAA